MKPLELYRDGEKVVCAFTLYIDPRAGEPEEMRQLMLDGLGRIAGCYGTDKGPVEIEVRVNIADKFSLGAVNVHIIDETPVIRKWYSPRINVSRAYYGARARAAEAMAVHYAQAGRLHKPRRQGCAGPKAAGGDMLCDTARVRSCAGIQG